jgi:hypothetical protein
MKIHIASILFVIMSYTVFLRGLRLDITFGSFFFLDTIDFKPVLIWNMGSEESFAPMSEWSLFGNRFNKLTNGAYQVTINTKLFTSDAYDCSEVTSNFVEGKISTSSIGLPWSCIFSSKITLEIDEIVFFNRIFNVYVSITCGSSVKSNNPVKTGLTSAKLSENAHKKFKGLRTVNKSTLMNINKGIISKTVNRIRRPFPFMRHVAIKSTLSRISKPDKHFGVESSLKQFNLQKKRIQREAILHK